jgi:hypothetical protein
MQDAAKAHQVVRKPTHPAGQHVKFFARGEESRLEPYQIVMPRKNGPVLFRTLQNGIRWSVVRGTSWQESWI